MPLERRASSGAAREDGVGERLRGQRDREQPDLRRGPGVDRPPRLAASSCAPRQAPQNGVPARTASAISALLLASQAVDLVVDAHRAAHRDDRLELAPVGQRVAVVELDAVDVGAALEQHVLVVAGRLAGDVLEHERSHAGMIPYRQGRLFVR